MRSSPVGKLCFVLMVCAVLLAYASVGFGLTQVLTGKIVPDDKVAWDDDFEGWMDKECDWHLYPTYHTEYNDVLLYYSDGIYITTKKPDGTNHRNVVHAKAWEGDFSQVPGYDVDDDHESVRMWVACGPNNTRGDFSLTYYTPPFAGWDWTFTSWVDGITNAGWRTVNFLDEDYYPYWWDPTRPWFPWTTDTERDSVEVVVWGEHNSGVTAGSFAIDSVILRWYVYE